jgi:hypothetical protein
LPGFQELDVRIEKAWQFRRWAFTAYLDVRNVYDYGNIAGAYSYNFDATQTTARVGLPILPLLGARADF